jgi:hypothetical protein
LIANGRRGSYQSWRPASSMADIQPKSNEFFETLNSRTRHSLFPAQKIGLATALARSRAIGPQEFCRDDGLGWLCPTFRSLSGGLRDLRSFRRSAWMKYPQLWGQAWAMRSTPPLGLNCNGHDALRLRAQKGRVHSVSALTLPSEKIGFPDHRSPLYRCCRS